MQTPLFLLALTVATATAVPEALRYPIVDTGQTRCYDAAGAVIVPAAGQPFYGQDGSFQGIQPAYKDNGDGSTTDLNTGLTWVRKPPSGKFPWSDATQVAADLNAKNFGGHHDWRIPSVKELYSIVHHAKGWPYIDTRYFECELAPQIQDQVKNTQYWTSDKSLAGGSRTAEVFGINFATGHIKAYAPGMGSYVRCVRGNPGYGKNDFTDNKDGTITDRATGLTWSREDSKKGLNWEEALAWVQTMNRENHLGHHDWRLPNVRELQSIVDYSREPGASLASVATAISPLFACTPITDQEGKPDCPYYWTGTSCYHGPNNQAYRSAWYVSFGRAQTAAGNGPGQPRSRLVAEAGAIRYDSKAKGGQPSGPGEGGERIYNHVRLVCGGEAAKPPATAAVPPPSAPATPSAVPAATPSRSLASPIVSALDTNQNGIIEAEELANAAAALKALDKNHDGKLTSEEYRPQNPGGPGGGPPARTNGGLPFPGDRRGEE